MIPSKDLGLFVKYIKQFNEGEPAEILQWTLKKNGKKYRFRRYSNPQDGSSWKSQRKTDDGGGGYFEESIDLENGVALCDRLHGFTPKGFVDKIRHHLKMEFLKVLARDNEHVLSWLEERGDEIIAIDFDRLVNLQGEYERGGKIKLGTPIRLELEFSSHAAKFSFPWAGLVQDIANRIQEEVGIKIHANQKGQRTLAEGQYDNYKDTAMETPLTAYLALDATKAEKGQMTELIIKRLIETYSACLLFVVTRGATRASKELMTDECHHSE